MPVNDTPLQQPVASARDVPGARLRELAGLLDDRDRTMGRIVRLLVALKADDHLPECLGGMPLQVWLEHEGRVRGPEARSLLGAVDVLEKMPRVVGGLCDRWLSWTQVDAICRAARRVPIARLEELDALVDGAMVDMATFEPDALVADVWQWADTVRPSRLEREEAARERDDFLTLAPRLFGGGSLYAEFGTVAFATVAEALDAPLRPTPTIADADDPDEVDGAYATLDDQRRRLTREHGARLAGRLVDLCEDALAGTDPGDGDTAGARVPPRPLLLAVADLDTLLDADRAPAWLLHTLAGGRMKVSSTTLQRLVEERGADLSGIVLDDCGDVVGVGTRSYVPPGWLREAIWARDLTVRDPDGATPIRTADLDHLDPWRDDGAGGPTDATNLAPVGRPWHNRKTSKRWSLTRDRDGAVVWRHRRHGWTIRLAPPRRDLADPPATGPPRLPLDLPGTDPPDAPRSEVSHPPAGWAA